MQHGIRIKNKAINAKLLLWSINLILFILIELFYYNKTLKYDALGYWARGESLALGGFNITKLDGFRGYIFPLYLGITYLFKKRLGWMIINAIVISACQTFVVYNLGFDIKSNKKNYISIVCANIMLVLLFSGLFGYPLSDYFALMCCCCSILAIRKGLSNKTKFRYVWLLLSGVTGYWAYNTRTIYLFAGGVLFIIYLVIAYRSECTSKLKIGLVALRSITIWLGIIIASIPQIIMNYSQFGRFSLGVPTDGLMLSQMEWGMTMQMYATYMMKDANEWHTLPSVIFSDPVGLEILSELQIDHFASWSDYIKTLLSHPVDMVIMYFRHGINFLLPCWPQVYIYDLKAPKFLWGLIGTIIIFATILVFTEKSIKNYRSLIYYTPIVLTGLLIIPGAVENRFSLPLYFFAISQLCFNVDYNRLKQIIVENKIKILFYYLLFAFMCFAIWSDTLANENFGALLF